MNIHQIPKVNTTHTQTPSVRTHADGSKPVTVEAREKRILLSFGKKIINIYNNIKIRITRQVIYFFIFKKKK